ncbi:UNVERIFIED_CONTAM: Stom [Trichonephila clavipes]
MRLLLLYAAVVNKRRYILQALVLSKDSVTVSVDAVVYYRISDATTAVSNVANYDSSTQLLAATTLRTVLGTKSLSEILSEREHISHVMQENAL